MFDVLLVITHPSLAVTVCPANPTQAPCPLLPTAPPRRELPAGARTARTTAPPSGRWLATCGQRACCWGRSPWATGGSGRQRRLTCTPATRARRRAASPALLRDGPAGFPSFRAPSFGPARACCPLLPHHRVPCLPPGYLPACLPCRASSAPSPPPARLPSYLQLARRGAGGGAWGWGDGWLAGCRDVRVLEASGRAACHTCQAAPTCAALEKPCKPHAHANARSCRCRPASHLPRPPHLQALEPQRGARLDGPLQGAHKQGAVVQRLQVQEAGDAVQVLCVCVCVCPDTHTRVWKGGGSSGGMRWEAGGRDGRSGRELHPHAPAWSPLAHRTPSSAAACR